MTQVELDKKLQASTHMKKIHTELSTHGNQPRRVENGIIGTQTATLTNAAPDVVKSSRDHYHGENRRVNRSRHRSYSTESQYLAAAISRPRRSSQSPPGTDWEHSPATGNDILAQDMLEEASLQAALADAIASEEELQQTHLVEALDATTCPHCVLAGLLCQCIGGASWEKTRVISHPAVHCMPTVGVRRSLPSTPRPPAAHLQAVPCGPSGQAMTNLHLDGIW